MSSIHMAAGSSASGDSSLPKMVLMYTTNGDANVIGGSTFMIPSGYKNIEAMLLGDIHLSAYASDGTTQGAQLKRFLNGTRFSSFTTQTFTIPDTTTEFVQLVTQIGGNLDSPTQGMIQLTLT